MPFTRARSLIRQALREDGIAGRIDTLVEDLLGPDPDRPVAPSVRRIPTRERARLFAEAQEHSRRLRDDPAERAILDEIEEIQADNADVLD
jgi:hypothetical protein